MRMINADELLKLLTTAIRTMRSIAKFSGAQDDPKTQREITAYTDIANIVKEMSTIEPERKKGKWIDRNGNIVAPFWERYECSECGARSDNSNYCPNCGSYNGGENEETDIS